MIDDVSTHATDYPTTVRFYDAVLGALGYAPHAEMEVPNGRMAAYGPEGQYFFRVIEVQEAAIPCHVVFVAPDRAAVDRFHRVGLEAGGTDNGAPRERPQVHPGYYGAFLHDPDGNNVEAMVHR